LDIFGESTEARPRDLGVFASLCSLLRIFDSFFGGGLLYVPYVPYGVYIREKKTEDQLGLPVLTNEDAGDGDQSYIYIYTHTTSICFSW
jgi:hypothetical protein